jgi:hypothetical protein
LIGYNKASANKKHLTNEVNKMIQQKVLGFKIEKTEDTITPHGGLALAGEFLVGAKIRQLADKHLPAPGSGNGYQPSEYIYIP